MQMGRVSIEKKPVILNGVSPWAKVGAKRSEESLTLKWAEAVRSFGRVFHQTASAHLQSAILHCVPVRKASRNSVQDDGCFFRLTRKPR